MVREKKGLEDIIVRRFKNGLKGFLKPRRVKGEESNLIEELHSLFWLAKPRTREHLVKRHWIIRKDWGP